MSNPHYIIKKPSANTAAVIHVTEFVIIHFWKVLHYAAGDGANICAYYVEVSLCTHADHVKGLLTHTVH